jgi:tryptophan 2,3-dioxygenase
VVFVTVLGTPQRYWNVSEDSDELTEMGAPHELMVGWFGRVMVQLSTGRKTGSGGHAASMHVEEMKRMIRT